MHVDRSQQVWLHLLARLRCGRPVWWRRWGM